MTRIRLRPGDDVRALWLLALIIFAGGWARVEIAYGGAISACSAATQTLYRQTTEDRRTLLQQTYLRRLERTAGGDLGRIASNMPLSLALASLLETLQRNAAATGISVQGIEPQTAQAVVTGPPAAVYPADAPRLLQTDLRIRVRGSFQNILHFVAHLSHNRTLIRVSQTELAISPLRNAFEHGEPVLDATVHATFYRLQLPITEERPLASP